MRIDAAVLRAADAPYSIEPVELADPGPGELIVKIAGTGMCHTDLLGRAPDMLPKPVILGHEGAGVVEAVGPGVPLAPGTPVVLSFDSCGDCANCRAARPGNCASMAPLNMFSAPLDGRPRATGADGGALNNRWFGQSSFATHALATVRNAVPVDGVVGPDTPLELLGPLGCGMQTGAGSVLVALGVRPGDSIAVFGTGAVGLAAVMAARIAGATRIIGVDTNPARLDLARGLGATHVLHGDDEDIPGQIRAVVGSEGVQYALDTTAVPEVVASAVAALRTTGVCGLVGVGGAEYRLDPGLLLMGRTVRGIIEGDVVPQTFIPRLVELWKQGRFPFDSLIGTYPLSDVGRAEADAVSGKVVKPVLLPESP